MPAGTTAAVRAKAAGKLDPARILEHEERTRHDVIAFLTHVEELAGEPARWLHLGMTSSDVLDASLAIQLVRGARIRSSPASTCCAPPAAAAPTSTARRSTIGRSHGIHAEPITAGLVFAGWYAELGRAQARARARRARRSRSARSPARSAPTPTWIRPIEQRGARRRSGLRRETVPTQVVARDRHAAYFLALARLGTAVERMALTVRHWQRTEVGEATEAFGKGQKGSLGDAAQEEPDPVREPVRLARLLRSYAQRRRSRTSRSGTSATSRTRRSSA